VKETRKGDQRVREHMEVNCSPGEGIKDCGSDLYTSIAARANKVKARR
jgi:hypothetical protein